MKASELRIGNLVGLNLKEFPHNVFKMHEVAESCAVVLDDIEKSYYDPDLLDPIPLNEEWLLKLGATKASDNTHFFINHHGFCVVFDDLDWCLKARIDEPYIIAYCRYVHQFQNLYFSITGREI